MDGLRWLHAQWDRTAGWALIGGGALLVATAASQARQGLYVPDQFSLLMSGGLGGLACAALGSALMLSASLHDEWRAFHDIEAAVRGGSERVAGEGRRGPLLALWIRAQWDRVLGWALVAAAFVWLLIGYRQLADSLHPPAQIAYLISAGLAALACLFVGLAVLFFADLRDEEHKLRRVDLALGGSTDQEVEDRFLNRPWLFVVLLAATVVVVGLGWARAAHALEVDRAMEGLDVAVAGLGGSLVVLSAMVVSLRRRFVRRAGHVLARIGEAGEPEGTPQVAMNGEGFWTVQGLRRYHRASCPALTWARGERQPVAGSASGLDPCHLCDAGE